MACAPRGPRATSRHAPSEGRALPAAVGRGQRDYAVLRRIQGVFQLEAEIGAVIEAAHRHANLRPVEGEPPTEAEASCRRIGGEIDLLHLGRAPHGVAHGVEAPPADDGQRGHARGQRCHRQADEQQHHGILRFQGHGGHAAGPGGRAGTAPVWPTAPLLCLRSINPPPVIDGKSLMDPPVDEALTP